MCQLYFAVVCVNWHVVGDVVACYAQCCMVLWDVVRCYMRISTCNIVHSIIGTHNCCVNINQTTEIRLVCVLYDARD